MVALRHRDIRERREPSLRVCPQSQQEPKPGELGWEQLRLRGASCEHDWPRQDPPTATAINRRRARVIVLFLT
jgi:hypothetical protein